MNIGIDVGGSHIAVGLISDEMQIISKKEHKWTQEEKNILLNSTEEYCKKLIKEIIQENSVKIDKIGIGFPSDNIVNGIVTKYGQTMDLSSILSKEFGVPTYLKNDVKCSAICEKTLGNLTEYNNCIFMTLGTGIGGAYFYKNELVVPNKYPGLEIGHMIIQVNGNKCRCGRLGCFEEYASMRVFRKEVEELFNIKDLTSFKMFEIIDSKEKQQEVEEIIDNYLNYLSIGLTNIINIFEPDAICIGGSFALYASIFMDKLKQKLEQNFSNKQIPETLTAKYENDAGMIGASMLTTN